MTQKNRRFYIFSILLILFGFSLILAGQVFAQDHIGKITTAKANVRQGAGTSYPLAFQLSENQQVTIKESKEGWLLVETNKGKGWIAAASRCTHFTRFRTRGFSNWRCSKYSEGTQYSISQGNPG